MNKITAHRERTQPAAFSRSIVVHIELSLVLKDPYITNAIFVAVPRTSARRHNNSLILRIISELANRPSVRVVVDFSRSRRRDDQHGADR
jgi:hypothetical protein